MISDQNLYAISAGHRDTMESAKLILDSGGNAVDAAISAFLVSMVAEPCMSSPGGGGMALIKDTDRNIFSCDFFCQTPGVKIDRKKEHFYPVTVDFGGTTEDFYIGAGSIAVPGSIAGIYKLHSHFGKIPLKELFYPAIELAKKGTVIDQFQAYDIDLLKGILNQSSHSKKLFFNGEKSKKEGEVLQFDKMADFFEVLSKEGEQFFYQGEIAGAIDGICREMGGHLTWSDLKNYRASIRPAYRFPIRNYDVYTVGFPSKGGPLVAAMLDFIKIEDIRNPLEKSHLKSLKDALKEAIELKNSKKNLANYIRERFGIIIGEGGGLKSGGTTHFSIEDKDGMAISLTTSLGEGSGIWIENSDIQLNNMLGEEALMENGFYNWVPNSRLMTMMTPTIVNKDASWLITGSGGAGRIPFVLGQLIHYVFDLGLSLDISTEMPRVFYNNDRYEVEPGFVPANDENENHWPSKSLFFGGANSIISDGKTITASADERRFGAAYYK